MVDNPRRFGTRAEMREPTKLSDELARNVRLMEDADLIYVD
jgi:hypothetical protein